MLLSLDEDTFGVTLSFCDPNSLFSLLQTSKLFSSRYLHDYSKNIISFDNCKWLRIQDAFQILCILRWNVDTKKSMKTLGAECMSALYILLASRMLIPKGKFTNRHNYVFAKGRHEGVGIWLLFGHTANARLRLVDFHGKLQHKIELRLGFQNINNRLVSLDLSPMDLQNLIKFQFRGPEVDYYEQGPLMNFMAIDAKVIYRNECAEKTYRRGEANNLAKDHSKYIVPLRAFDFILVSFVLLCPTSIENEVDFLHCVKSIEINTSIQREVFPEFLKSHCKRNNIENINTNIACKLLDEDKIVDYYEYLPGNVVLLKHAQSHSNFIK